MLEYPVSMLLPMNCSEPKAGLSSLIGGLIRVKKVLNTEQHFTETLSFINKKEYKKNEKGIYFY